MLSTTNEDRTLINEKHILIVDDDPSCRELLESLLQPMDLRVSSAADGQEALTIADRSQPDLVLLDVNLPDMDGFDVCRNMRSNENLSKVPVLMLTSMRDRRSMLKGLNSGADDFICKPFDLSVLLAKITNLLRLNRSRELSNSQLKYSWISNDIVDGFLTVGSNGYIIDANERARFYLGVEENEVSSGKMTFAQLAERHYQESSQTVNSDRTSSSPTPIETPRFLVRPETATHPAFWLQVTALELLSGTRGKRVLRLRDVTEKKNLEKNVWKFNSMVSHKLNTPMAGLIGSLELLAESYEELKPEEIREYVEMALTSARRFQGAVKHVLEFIDLPNLASNGSGFHVAMLADTVSEISKFLDLKDVKVAPFTVPQSDTLVISQTLLEFILREILENAQKFHPEKKPEIRIEINTNGKKHAVIRIADNGRTLSPSQIEQAFIPYFQGEKQFTGELNGMGLGLTRAASILNEVGGSCCLKNRRDAPGTVLELKIPFQSSDE